MSNDDPEVVERRQRVEHWSPPQELRWRRGQVDADEGQDGPPPRLPAHQHRPSGSRALHRLGDASSHAGAGLLAAGFVLAWLIVGVFVGFPDWWETVFYSSSSAVTLVMVFAIQHTQSRHQSATHRKLDELLRSQPGADNQLIDVEDAPDHELQARADLNREDRERAADQS